MRKMKIQKNNVSGSAVYSVLPFSIYLGINVLSAFRNSCDKCIIRDNINYRYSFEGEENACKNRKFTNWLYSNGRRI